MKPARSTAAVLDPDGVRIPGSLVDLVAFRRWMHSGSFPEKGRIDWIAGDVEVDMSPEEVNTHGTPKMAIARELGRLVEDRDLGVVFVDSTRITCPDADLSVEPDVVVVLFVSVDGGRVKLVPSPGSGGRNCPAPSHRQGATRDSAARYSDTASAFRSVAPDPWRSAPLGRPRQWYYNGIEQTSIQSLPPRVPSNSGPSGPLPTLARTPSGTMTWPNRLGRTWRSGAFLRSRRGIDDVCPATRRRAHERSSMRLRGREKPGPRSTPGGSAHG